MSTGLIVVAGAVVIGIALLGSALVAGARRRAQRSYDRNSSGGDSGAYLFHSDGGSDRVAPTEPADNEGAPVDDGASGAGDADAGAGGDSGGDGGAGDGGGGGGD